MADDEYVEGDSGSEAADAPGAVPKDDAAPTAAERIAKPKDNTFESTTVIEAPEIKRADKTQRMRESRKAFAEAVIASKAANAATAATAKATVADEYDPEAEPAAPAPAPSPTQKAAKPGMAPPPAIPAPAPAVVAQPPAPSLDPEVRKLREQAKAEREAIAAERAAWEKQKAAPVAAAPDALSIEDYVDRPSNAYRTWLETMRGEKFANDDEFKLEARDFVTAISVDVLGVPLPADERNGLESRQARKAVRVSKTVAARREAELAAKVERERAEADTKAETERVEQEWSKAEAVLSQQFAPQRGADGKPVASTASEAYPWLAAEDEPGKHIVSWIRAAFKKDGTQLSWQEASQGVNDYLRDEATSYYEKRRPLLAPKPVAPAAPAAPAAKAAAPVAKPAAPTPRVAPVDADKTTKWSKERHLEASKARFRQAFEPKP